MNVIRYSCAVCSFITNMLNGCLSVYAAVVPLQKLIKGGAHVYRDSLIIRVVPDLIWICHRGIYWNPLHISVSMFEAIINLKNYMYTQA